MVALEMEVSIKFICCPRSLFDGPGYHSLWCQLQIILDNLSEPVNMELSMDMKTLAILFIYCTGGV